MRCVQKYYVLPNSLNGSNKHLEVIKGKYILGRRKVCTTGDYAEKLTIWNYIYHCHLDSANFDTSIEICHGRNSHNTA
jgi:hypothetical protein